MGIRGRASTASLVSVLAHRGPPEPPEGLPEDQAEVWRNVVKNMPSNWFGSETHALLVQLCRHVARANQINEMIADAEKNNIPDPKLYQQFLRQELSQSVIIAALSTKMRISQQATYEKPPRKSASTPDLG